MTWSPSVSLDQVIVVAGVGQLALVLASLAIPRVLGWHRELMHLRPLTRQVFWTYAGYIWGTNLSFGLVSVIGPGWLLDRSPLAGGQPGKPFLPGVPPFSTGPTPGPWGSSAAKPGDGSR